MAGSCLLAAGRWEAACLTYKSTLIRARPVLTASRARKAKGRKIPDTAKITDGAKSRRARTHKRRQSRRATAANGGPFRAVAFRARRRPGSRAFCDFAPSMIFAVSGISRRYALALFLRAPSVRCAVKSFVYQGLRAVLRLARIRRTRALVLQSPVRTAERCDVPHFSPPRCRTPRPSRRFPRP